ncbi:hypothetical protein [Melissococcus plutonius]|uniref:hypothetical protein n=1 Tax=Melissococcus plutonius TaxID=33970 RepID=UPI00065DE7DF|nr:hypothetical protein [Melissococcus plutonius]
MLEEDLLKRVPQEPTVKQVRLALKFGGEFNRLEKMQTETGDYGQAIAYFAELVDTAIDFVKTILKLKPKEIIELEDCYVFTRRNAFRTKYKMVGSRTRAL